MTVLVDTSALVAVLVATDPDHEVADRAWRWLLGSGIGLRTHSYVVVETTALVQRRHGLEAARSLHLDILPVISVRYVDPDLHRRAVTALLAAGRRAVSLVDWTSFELMREEGITEAFAFDEDFMEQGFRLTSRP